MRRRRPRRIRRGRLDRARILPISGRRFLRGSGGRTTGCARRPSCDRRRAILACRSRWGRATLSNESLSPMSTQLLLTQAAGSGGGAAGFLMLVPYILIFAVFWFFLIRPQQVRAKEHRAKIAAVKPRDQVVTGGGIVGKVTRVDDDYADVEIAQGVKVKVVKATLADVLQPGGKPAND
ncbi:protein translocase subunit yajC [Sphingopyxis alaskensis RB2256]|uniref:Sec translocon accessory complex subunit YajC n=2 Tax=Sphingopyxis alaskensis TaxID=117207 RepID=Q1GSE4_SPHAL|nr:protein translocase subunit yajC [Sphingopyxis alaskensis RB2256]